MYWRCPKPPKFRDDGPPGAKTSGLTPKIPSNQKTLRRPDNGATGAEFPFSETPARFLRTETPLPSQRATHTTRLLPNLHRTPGDASQPIQQSAIRMWKGNGRTGAPANRTDILRRNLM